MSETMQVQCSACGRKFQVPSEWSGKSGKCKCGEKLRIPTQPTQETAISVKAEVEPLVVAAKRPLREELLAQLPEKIAPVRTPIGYILALAIVATIMVLLPILYIGLIASAAYGVYWHFSYSDWFDSLLDSARGKAKVFVVMLYVAPGIVGGILVLFMLKPFYRRNPKRGLPNSLDRSEEPILFEYVDRLCDVMKAPRPIRIDIDQRVNASASFESPMSLLSNRLVLTIGLPLAEGLTLSQFSSILAHEFGHFSQAWAMRFYYIIETINLWFRRVAVERDTLDRKLSDASEQLPSQIGWVVILAQFMVWCVRQILTGFRYVGVFVSRRLSRQMEFDADQFAIRVTGTRCTIEAFDRIGLLAIGETIANRSSSQFLHEGHALDNYSRFVVHQADMLPNDQATAFLRTMHDQPAAWTSTHPSTSERIQRIKLSHDSLNPQAEIRAWSLFRDFSQLCRELTRKSYRRGSGAEVDMNELTSVDQLIVEETDRRQKYELARSLVLQADTFLEHWATPKENWASDLSDKELEADIRRIKQQLEHGREIYQAQCSKWRNLKSLFHHALLARIVIVVRGRTKKDEFPGIPGNLRAIAGLDEMIKEPTQVNDRLEGEMAEYERLCVTRFLRGLQLAVRRGADESRLAELYLASLYIGAVSSGVRGLETRLKQLEWLFDWLAEKPGHPTAKACMEKLCLALIDEFQTIYGELSVREFPFPLPYETASLSAALLPHFTDQSNPVLLHRDIGRFCSGYRTLKNRVIGELAVAAQALEISALQPKA